MNRAILFAAILLGAAPAFAEAPIMPEGPPLNVQLYETYGPAEYSRLEDGLYFIGSKLSDRDVSEVCAQFRNGCRQETTIWQLDEFPGIRVLVDHRGNVILAILFERRGVVLDRFELGPEGVKIFYDGLPFGSFRDCANQRNRLTSKFTFDDRYAYLSSFVELAPCDAEGRKKWSAKFDRYKSEIGMATYEIEYSVQEVDK
jgi:hypothetical protein